MRYEPELDGVRGVAILLVMAGHAGVIGFADGGLVGVTIFFVLSGYLITGVLLHERSEARVGSISAPLADLGAFYLRRAARLLPALVLLLTTVSVVALALGAWSQVATGVLTAALYVANIADASGANMGSLEHTWSLAMEEQFYLVWPILLLLLGPTRRLVAVALAGIVVSAGIRALSGTDDASLWTAAHLPVTRADALLVGCVARLLSLPRLHTPSVVAASAMLAATVVVGVAPEIGVRYLLLPIALAAVVLILARPAFLRARPLIAVGGISYGLYLWHMPLAVAFGPVGMVAAFPIAYVSHRILELPIQGAVRQWLRTVRSPTAPPAPVPGVS